MPLQGLPRQNELQTPEKNSGVLLFLTLIGGIGTIKKENDKEAAHGTEICSLYQLPPCRA